MSLRPCIAKLSLNFWATRWLARSQIIVLRRVEKRPIGTRALPFELRETISPGVVKQLTAFHNELKVALEKRNANDICYSLTSSRRVFFTLPKSAWQYVCSTHLRLHKSDVEKIANVLAGRCRKGDAEALGQLLRDSLAMYGVEPSPELLLSALNALARTGQQIDAYDLLQLFVDYKKKPFRPNSTHWRAAMWGLAQIGDVEKLQECLDFMKSAWPFPGNPHYHALLEGLLRRSDPLSIDDIRQILQDMREFRLPYDDRVHDALTKFAKKFQFDSLPSEYKEMCSSQRRPTDDEVEEWLDKLIEDRKSGRLAFERNLNSFRHVGFIPDERALIKLVQMRSLSSSNELLYLHEIFELPPSLVAWTICMRNALEKNGWRGALTAFNTAKAQGIRPDSAMIHPLLRMMCSRNLQEPAEPVLDRALQMYKDLKDDAKSSGKPGADTGVYNTLLRALAASKNKQKFFPIAMNLLDEMRSEGVYMDRMTATSIAVLLVRSSSAYEEAAEAYKQVYSVNADGLDEKGFAAFLHAFCSLEPEVPTSSEKTETNPSESGTENDDESGKVGKRPLPIPPAKIYFQIVHEMQAQGLRKTPEIYTILLGRYSYLASRARHMQNPRRRGYVVRLIRKVIKQTHRQLSVDAGLQIDAPLLNQLMDAYNRAGLFTDVMKVWTMLNSTGLVSPASVSIVLDACGFHKESEQADAIFRDLEERGFQFNRRNLHSWVECLCRLGRLDDALKVVCFDMANADKAEIRPDVDTLNILKSFASVCGRSDEVRVYLKAHIPDLWNSLQNDIVNR